MAAQRTGVRADLARGNVHHTWTGLANGDNGDALEVPLTGGFCVQISGVFGVGGSVSIKATNLATIDTVNDPVIGAPITVAGVRQQTETPRFIYPMVTAGDGDTLLVCTVVLARGNI